MQYIVYDQYIARIWSYVSYVSCTPYSNHSSKTILKTKKCFYINACMHHVYHLWHLRHVYHVPFIGVMSKSNWHVASATQGIEKSSKNQWKLNGFVMHQSRGTGGLGGRLGKAVVFRWFVNCNTVAARVAAVAVGHGHGAATDQLKSIIFLHSGLKQIKDFIDFQINFRIDYIFSNKWY